MRVKTKALLDKLQIYYRSNPRKVRQGAMALVAFGILNYGTMHLASSSGLCGSCHEIYPAFETWKRSNHSGIACISCHRQPGTLGVIRRIGLQFTVFNTTRTRAEDQPPTHVADKELIARACEGCHSSQRAMAFSGGLTVPHQKHRDLGYPCTVCHVRVVHGKGGDKTRKPQMETCFVCHNGEKAPEACGVCHLTLSEPIPDYDPRNDRYQYRE